MQYVSKAYLQLPARNKITASMSRTGQPYDNAVMESHFASLKEEQRHPKRFDGYQQAESARLHYVEGFYSRTRLPSTLRHLSPAAYERNYWQQQQALKQQATVPGSQNNKCADKVKAEAVLA